MAIFSNPRALVIDAASGVITVAGGAAGWIDTDLTAWVPLGAVKVFIAGYPGAAQGWGVRAVGSAVDTNVVGASVSQWHLRVVRSIAGHVELRREAADNTYLVVGYEI